MSKSRGRKAPKTPRIPNPPRPTPKERSKWHSRLWAGALAVATLIGGYVAVLTLLPRVTIKSASDLDPATTSPIIPFTIGNTGFIALYDVQPMVGICSIDVAGARVPVRFAGPNCNGPLRARISPPNWKASRLEVDEKYQIRLDDAFKGVTITNAEISIVVEFQIWFYPQRIRKEFRFSTRKEANGKLTWMPRPLEK